MRGRTLRCICLVAVFAVGAGTFLTLPVGAGPAASPQRASTPEPLELLPLQTSADRRIVDGAGRDVLLRGANVNSLGEYWQGVPTIPATIPITDADWDLMASRGFSVVRLLITWSRVEPTRGVIDQDYLDEVEAAVDAAAARGIYTVIDMHQDAYSATVFTTDPASCPSGTSPARGWDGAPAWATLTDGLSTCLRGGDRNSSPAVERAWNNFYDNTDGIRDRFAASWAAVATRFAGRPEVAGYDVINEPENPRPAAQMQPVYDAFLADVITAIREAEAAAGASFEHIVFLEPALPAGDPSRGLVIPSPAALSEHTTNISASVHNYAESIIDLLTIEQMNDVIESATAALGVPNWGGEYGFWDVQPATLAKARRYAADEDAHLWGGAWWQWRQSCGDPHAVRWSNGEVVSHSGTETQLNVLGCPGNVDLGPNDAFLEVLGRGYPRAAPGRLVEVRSDVDTGWLKVRATATEPGGELVVWTPTKSGPAHQVQVAGLTDVVEHDVDGGRIITATVTGPGTYTLWVGEPDEELPIAEAGVGIVVEGDDGTTSLEVPITLSRAAEHTVTLRWSVLAGTSTIGSDVEPASGTVTFAPGETLRTAPVTVVGDTADENDEIVLVSLREAAGARVGGFLGLGYGVILDDDGGAPKVRVGSATATEPVTGTLAVEVPVTLSHPSSGEVTVAWRTAPYTATNGDDFDAAAGVVTFAPGETEATVTVTVRADAVTEPDEVLLVVLSDPTNAVVGGWLGIGGITIDG